MTYQSIQLVAEKALREPKLAGASGRYKHPHVSLVARSQPIPAAGHVLLKVCCTSICGTDVHVLQTDAEGYSCSSVPARNWERGIQFGHEMAAQIIRLGSEVEGVQVGDYVTADSLVPCRDRKCRTCRRRQWNECPESYLLGLQADGVFGEIAVAPARSIHSIDPLVRRFSLAHALQSASLAEPLGNALHCFSVARRWLRKNNPHVMVLGAGPAGLFLAWTARSARCRQVILVEPNSRRAEYARQFADVVLHPAEIESTLGSGGIGVRPDAVFDACGQGDMNQVLKALAPGGIVLTMARAGQKVCVAGDTLVTNGQAIVGVRGHVGYVPKAIEMLAGGGIDPEMFISRTLDGISQLHAALCEPNSLCSELKVSCRI